METLVDGELIWTEEILIWQARVFKWEIVRLCLSLYARKVVIRSNVSELSVERNSPQLRIKASPRSLTNDAAFNTSLAGMFTINESNTLYILLFYPNTREVTEGDLALFSC